LPAEPIAGGMFGATVVGATETDGSGAITVPAVATGGV
jgi:hypothetical protein